MPQRRELPDRIWVVGPTGSGKSTVATALGRRLGVEAAHLDDIHWRPGWVEAPPAETAARIAEVVARPRWVIDGNYARFRAPHTDAVQLWVWLDFPLHLTFRRLVWRGLRRSLRREPCCNGNYESLGRMFLHRESLLLWALDTHTRRRKQLARVTAFRPHVRLRSQRDVDRWLANAVRAEA